MEVPTVSERTCALCHVPFPGVRRFCYSCCPSHGDFATTNEYAATYNACMRGLAAGLSVPLAPRPLVGRQPPKPILSFEVQCKYCTNILTVLAKSQPKPGTRVCSKKCAARHQRHGVRALLRASTAPPPSPPDTGPSYGEPVPCVMCGVLHKRTRGRWSYCSEPCRKLALRDRERRKNWKRRSSATQEGYTIMQVFQRDGDRCCLCGKKGINVYDSSSFEVEHRLPRSKGGLDTLANVGLAHPSCNAEKSDGLFRGQPEQLRLVG